MVAMPDETSVLLREIADSLRRRVEQEDRDSRARIVELLAAIAATLREQLDRQVREKEEQAARLKAITEKHPPQPLSDVIAQARATEEARQAELKRVRDESIERSSRAVAQQQAHHESVQRALERQNELLARIAAALER
jgi:hypothetical protein